MPMALTSHFNIDEFTRTDLAQFQDKNKMAVGIYLGNILKLCEELEKLRVHIFRPIIIYSGFRCEELNKAVGGVPTSQHLTGSAVDFAVKDFDDMSGLKIIFNWCLNNLNYGQLILESKQNRKPWVHMGLPREGIKPSAYLYNDGKYTIIR